MAKVRMNMNNFTSGTIGEFVDSGAKCTGIRRLPSGGFELQFEGDMQEIDALRKAVNYNRGCSSYTDLEDFLSVWGVEA